MASDSTALKLILELYESLGVAGTRIAQLEAEMAEREQQPPAPEPPAQS